MIEIICNEENSDKSKQVTRGAAIRRPKNIKQIGEVSSDKKIYIEDYAFTYINSIAYNNPSDSQAGVLLGESQTDGNEKCVFIKGIIKAKLGTEVEEKGVYFNENVWNGIYSDVEKYFPNLSVVGWFAAIPEVTPERMMKLKKIHLDNFAGSMKTLYLIDTVEKEENFYLYENGTLKRQKGYVCFYERNYEMQEYMLERSEKKSCEDASDDRVIRNIRNVIREKEELKEQRKSGSFMYGVSAFLVVVIIVIGINLMNNYEKMRRLNQSVDNLMNQLEGNERGGQDGDDNGVRDSEASGDISVDGNAIKVNRLSGDVYPLEENSTSDKTERETESDNKAASETTQAISESETDASVSSVKTDSYSMYTVKQGDTLMGICKRYYGTTTKYQEVMQYNGLDDSDMLYIGQQIKLPE